MVSLSTPRRPTSAKPLAVCLINPRFEPSFFGFDFALPLMPRDKRCWVVTGALPALAALAPPHCSVTLLDENVEQIDFRSLARFDVIGVTGMIVQSRRMREILEKLQGLPAMIVIGGPYASVAEDAFAGLCDVRFVGEAEETWPAFLTALAAGEPTAKRYEQSERTDMRSVPAPRYDLLKADRYQMASLQFSRGCPFLCEFCDIITVFGRKPRSKSPEQMLVECEAVRRAGLRRCFLVDDNFIGNKKEARRVLVALIAWQRSNGYPLEFYTEASIDLAEHPDLIELMVQANFNQVFIGIESPRAKSLAETRKMQNIRGDSLENKIRRIRDGGLVVQAGFIVGFDSDDELIFDEQFEFIQRAGIAQALVARLSPVPTTPLYARLKAEGRLDFADDEIVFRPKHMSRDALKQGHAGLMRRLYEPESYFGRLFAGYRESPDFRRRRAARPAAAAAPRKISTRLGVAMAGVVQASKLGRAMQQAGMLKRLGGAYLQVWWRLNRPLGRDAIPFQVFVGMCVIHWHFFNMAQRPRDVTFGNVAANLDSVAA
jgi:radical SAM superfamily enzyme YgiQ (UPF0313 family)